MHVVIGASGKTGQHLCISLLSHGERVRALGRDQQKLAGLKALGAECATPDILDLDSLWRCFLRMQTPSI